MSAERRADLAREATATDLDPREKSIVWKIANLREFYKTYKALPLGYEGQDDVDRELSILRREPENLTNGKVSKAEEQAIGYGYKV